MLDMEDNGFSDIQLLHCCLQVWDHHTEGVLQIRFGARDDRHVIHVRLVDD